jgi:hypothetical protein
MTDFTYLYEDPDGVPLTVHAYNSAKWGQVASFRTGETIYITREALPAVTAALYRACGLPAPVILDRPELSGTYSMVGYARIGPSRDDPARLEVDTGHLGTITPAIARVLAAHIAARADAIESGPAADDVEALATTITGASEAITAVDVARAILRAGYRPPERPS